MGKFREKSRANENPGILLKNIRKFRKYFWENFWKCWENPEKTLQKSWTHFEAILGKTVINPMKTLENSWGSWELFGWENLGEI
jgi:hypothetical protein